MEPGGRVHCSVLDWTKFLQTHIDRWMAMTESLKQVLTSYILPQTTDIFRVLGFELASGAKKSDGYSFDKGSLGIFENRPWIESLWFTHRASSNCNRNYNSSQQLISQYNFSIPLKLFANNLKPLFHSSDIQNLSHLKFDRVDDDIFDVFAIF